MMEHMVSFCKVNIGRNSFDSMTEFENGHWLSALSKSLCKLEGNKNEVMLVKTIVEHCLDKYIDVTWTSILKYVAAYGQSMKGVCTRECMYMFEMSILEQFQTKIDYKGGDNLHISCMRCKATCAWELEKVEVDRKLTIFSALLHGICHGHMGLTIPQQSYKAPH